MAKQKILIIEDEPVHLNVMKAKLEYEGYDVLVAVDGEAGYQMIKAEKPDLVLLDIILPKLDGFGVLEKLKKDKISIPIIIVSNSGQPVEVDRAMQLGAKDYLVKAEFNPADVLEKVEKVLGAPASLKSDFKPARPAGGSPKKSDFFPAGASSSAKTSEASAAKNSGSAKEGAKILIVEDDKFLRDLIVQKLKREGFATSEAVDGEEGLKIAKEKRPDIILLDLILPGLDGFEVLRRMKSDASTASIPVIVLSNLGQKEDMDRAMSGGAEDFMVKAHFTPGEIIAKIKSVLKKKYF
ncbi:MAG: response regulator [Candidatus Giovannonibacteria bacterium]|nr:response regulator [Candidatus Giovannonibacteria bacterium]